MDTPVTQSSDEHTTEITSAKTVLATYLENVVVFYDNFPKLLQGAMLLLFLITFVLNTIVSHALYRARRLKPVLRVLLLNLAISDAATAIVNLYHIAMAWVGNTFTVECIIRYALVIELMTVTLFFIVVLSLDRVVALVTALRYEEFVTTRRLWIVAFIIWGGSVLFPVAGLAGVDTKSEYCIFQLFLPRYSFLLYGSGSLSIILFVVGLNLFTLRKTLAHIRQIAQTVVGDGKEAAVSAMNYKAAVTSLLIVLPFLLLCSPLYLLFLCFAFYPGLTESLDGLVALASCLGLIVANSLVNPVIYVWRSSEVRAEVKRFICLRKFFAMHNPEQNGHLFASGQNPVSSPLTRVASV